eukprot:gnl/MRDRNA2_/MRDRNA2_99472_c0_seq1.p1 gnl/MRDRNA2_/MRDRNA2_99472_c0~~gnl/MRDRNA2_/MRDRNA2_99472_c0_seq1.p1  ORF type:complete len:574 (+),score=136.31 gnl/MRDRNA2_/MRDRNA2_99472_c0_seq1:62-1783(+)
MLNRGVVVPHLRLPSPPIDSQKCSTLGFSWGTGLLDDSYDSMAGSLDDTYSDVESNGASDATLPPFNTQAPTSLPAMPNTAVELSPADVTVQIRSNASKVGTALLEVEDLRKKLMEAQQEILQMEAETKAELGESKELHRELDELQTRHNHAKHITDTLLKSCRTAASGLKAFVPDAPGPPHQEELGSGAHARWVRSLLGSAARRARALRDASTEDDQAKIAVQQQLDACESGCRELCAAMFAQLGPVIARQGEDLGANHVSGCSLHAMMSEAEKVVRNVGHRIRELEGQAVALRKAEDSGKEELHKLRAQCPVKGNDVQQSCFLSRIPTPQRRASRTPHSRDAPEFSQLSEDAFSELQRRCSAQGMLLDAQGVSIQREEKRSNQLAGALASLQAMVRRHASEASMCHEATAAEDKLRTEVRLLRREARTAERRTEELKQTGSELQEEVLAATQARQSRNSPHEAAMSEVRAAVASALVQQRPALCAQLRDEVLQRLPDLDIQADSKKVRDSSQGSAATSVGRFTEERAKNRRQETSVGARGRGGLSERTAVAKGCSSSARSSQRSPSPALQR